MTNYQDTVYRPSHYLYHPSGVECIVVTEHMNFNVGNAFKYLFRCGVKGPAAQDLRKALWYVNREISLRLKRKFRWFAEDNEYDAKLDGDEDIRMILECESRYSGRMSSALERLYTAHIVWRGVKALEHAQENIQRMISIEEKEPESIMSFGSMDNIDQALQLLDDESFPYVLIVAKDPATLLIFSHLGEGHVKAFKTDGVELLEEHLNEAYETDD